MAVTVMLPLVPPTQMAAGLEGCPVIEGAAVTVTVAVLLVTEEHPLPEALTTHWYW